MQFIPSDKEFNFFPVWDSLLGYNIQESRACQCWNVWKDGRLVQMVGSLEAARDWVQTQ